MAVTMEVELTVNGHEVRRQIPVRHTLAEFLREDLGLTGTHLGCEHGICGTCTVQVDGDVVRSCLMLAVQAAGSQVVTIEGTNTSPLVAELREAFDRNFAMQCGFCTPGFLMVAAGFLSDEQRPDVAQVRRALASNLCRCTGYASIQQAVMEVAEARLAKLSPEDAPSR
jgi:carbon-monoxide dehydrogenase small subunit